MKHDKQNLEALIFHFPSENTFLCVTSSGAGLFCFFFSTDFDEQHKIEISIHFIRCLLHRAEPHCRPELMHRNVTIQISWKMICISSGRSQKHRKSIIIPPIHVGLYRFISPCYLHHCCEWGNDRAGSWGDNLSGADSNAPHRRPITSNARRRGEDVPDQDRGRVTACFCISGSLADENVYSGGMNQCWGEILIHFHLKFPFKFLYLWVRGRVALWSCTVPQVTLSLKIKFEGRTTASVWGSQRTLPLSSSRLMTLIKSVQRNYIPSTIIVPSHKQHRQWDMLLQHNCCLTLPLVQLTLTDDRGSNLFRGTCDKKKTSQERIAQMRVINPQRAFLKKMTLPPSTTLTGKTNFAGLQRTWRGDGDKEYVFKK